MRNAKERNKLLGKIAELEQGSVNYFDVEKEFFLIDSENLSEVQTRFYGYSIQADGIYEEDNLTPEAVKGLDGRGCYVYVEARDEKITIKQDLNGSWGIYLFSHDDYFALSNSFFRLLDHVKFRYPLTLNRDYCYHLMLNTLTSHAYSETAVNEIQMVERNAILQIDIAEKNLKLKMIDYKEHSISLDSKEGIATLDRWVALWGKILRNIAKRTDRLSMDLSGGFDTRVPLAIMLNSGIDCKKLSINSFTDHAHSEDYKIATEIAKHYDFALNEPFPECRIVNYSFCDSLNIDLYHRQLFKKLPSCPLQRTVEKSYRLSGYAGENIRGNWFRFNQSPMEFAKTQSNRARRYSPALAKKMSRSMKTILQSAYRSICKKYKIEDRNSIEIVQYLYQETRTRSHFGKNTVGRYFTNTFILAPALDPIVRTLRIDTPECPDPKLLIAVIFTRYEPDLLTFPFQGERFIAPETIAYAKSLNERFPRLKTTEENDDKEFHLQPIDIRTEKIFVKERNNPKIPEQLSRRFLKAAFDSSRTYGLFTAYFDAELYNHAANFYNNNKGSREKYSHSIYGIAKVLEDVEISRRNHPLYCDAKRFIEEDFAQVHVPDPIPPTE